MARKVACWLVAAGHHLSQCWLIVSQVLWHLAVGNFTEHVLYLSGIMIMGTINSMRPRFLEWKYLSLVYINLNRVASGLIDNGPAFGSTMAEYVQATCHYLNQWWLISLTHTWVTRPQWVKLGHHWYGQCPVTTTSHVTDDVKIRVQCTQSMCGFEFFVLCFPCSSFSVVLNCVTYVAERIRCMIYFTSCSATM